MSASTPASSTAPTLAELEAMAAAPDLTKAEQRELRKAIRFQRRVELWEVRRANPSQPRKLHRAVITGLMMVAMLWLLWLLNTGGS